MSMFVTENSGSPRQQKQPEQARPKRPRSSLACIRCRKKKVKCDFVQPTCGRCAVAGLPCSYATPPRKVDGHAFDQLGNHVEELKERMQKMQSELAMMKNNLHPFASATTTRDNPNVMVGDLNATNSMALTSASSAPDQSVTWKLSLSPSGLRIDTNIASVADLYRILLNGISQLNINNDTTTSLFNPEASSSSSSSANHMNTSRDRRQPTKSNIGRRNGNYLDSSMIDNNDRGGRLWEVDDNEAKKILQEKKTSEDTLPKEVLDNLMHTCYHTCFLAYQIVDKEQFMQQYMSEEGLDPLLANSINAWISKHGCIYHNVGGGLASATTMGEVCFKNARQLLKKCFDISSPTTIHALLNLYMYQLSSERSSLAYLYIGLAIRMAQDLKFHKKEHMSADLKQRETNKRLWWSAYWLDLCAALESNRPTMVDDKDCDLDYPVRLEHEDDEIGYRIHFTVYSIKLMRIRKDITKHLPSEQSGQSLLSAISRLENALTNLFSEMPSDLHFNDQAPFQKTGSFRDEACLILNIQYQTTWIMLHKFFLPKQDQTATPVALLSLNICTKSANLITRMLSIYASQLSWCHFFYAMDGIIASVTIHQVNALSNEKEVSFLAQRNLIITANILKESPLMYMTKVCDIIESIEGFLKKNNLSSNLNDLPPVNEDIINQQSISSVFHPAVFEPQTMMSNQNPTMMANQMTPQVQPLQQQQPHMNPHHQPSYTDALSPSVQSQRTMISSPQSQHSGSTIQVPSQLNQAMFQPTLQPTATASNAAGQQPLHKAPNVYNNPNMMVESTMFLNDPSLMGFNMPGQGGGDMDLFRNMGFNLNGGDRMYTMFDNNNNSSSSRAPNTNNTYTDSYAPTNDFTTAASATNTNNNTNNTDSTTAYPNYTELFGMTGAATTTTTSAPQPYATPGFDHLFGSMNMDMNALLGMPTGFTFQQQQQQQQNTTPDETIYGGGGGRKRVHRDWEDNNA